MVSPHHPHHHPSPKRGRPLRLALVGLILILCGWSVTIGWQYYTTFETSPSKADEDRLFLLPQPTTTTNNNNNVKERITATKSKLSAASVAVETSMNTTITIIDEDDEEDIISVIVSKDDQPKKTKKHEKKMKKNRHAVPLTDGGIVVDKHPDFNYVHRSPWETQQWRKRKSVVKQLQEMFPGPREQVADSTGTFPTVCQGKRLVDEIQIHTIGWKRPEGLANVLGQLEAANYSGWDQDIPLTIHIDGGSSSEVNDVVETFVWSHGSQHLNLRHTNVGLREIWLTSLRQAVSDSGNNTLLLVLEDDMVVSSAYFQWLMTMIDRYARNPHCRDSNLVGFSLSPLVHQNIYKPFHDWVADKELLPFLPTNGTRHAAFLASVPSSWGGVFFSDQWRRFDVFVTARIQPPFYTIGNERDTENLDPTPDIFHLPIECTTRSWTKSWKRFLVDWMYARGYFMLYPNLPNYQGLAYPLQNSGIHVNDYNKDRYKVELVENGTSTLEHIEDQLPPYHELKLVNLEHQVTSREVLMALGTRFLNEVSENCELEGCDALLNQWTHDDWTIPSVGFPPFPRMCVPDAYLSVAAQAFRPMIAQHKNSTGTLERYLLVPSTEVDIIQARLWAKVLGRRLIMLASNTSAALITADDDTKLKRRYQNFVDKIFKPSSQLVSLPDELDPLLLTQQQFSERGFKPWRILRLTGRTKEDEESSFFSLVSSSQVVDLRHVFENYSKKRMKSTQKLLEMIQHYLGECSDQVLALDGLLSPVS